MKKLSIYILLIIALINPFIEVHAIDYYEPSGCLNSHLVDFEIKESGYHIRNGRVHLGYCLVDGIDPDTAKFFNRSAGYELNYATDKDHVYLDREKLEKLDVDTFKIKDTGGLYVFYDQNYAYVRGVELINADPETLIYIDKHDGVFYLKDAKQVYRIDSYINRFDRSEYSAKVVENADPENFEFSYKITDDAVYWYGKKINEADSESFEVGIDYDKDLAKDKNNVYDQGEVMYGKDVTSFQVYDVKREGLPTLEVKLDKNRVETLKQEYPQEAQKIDAAIESAIAEYEEKYPGYTPQPAQPQQIFNDIPVDHEMYWKTKEASDDGWINGYPDGSFKPGDTVNRAEFAKMLTVAFNRGEDNGRNLEDFPDVYMDQWYVPYLSKAVQLGMMGGYPDGSMKPGNSINKAEALKMTLELIEKRVPESALADDAQWYQKYRLYAVENFDLDFVKDQQMSDKMTRGECVQLILEALKD